MNTSELLSGLQALLQFDCKAAAQHPSAVPGDLRCQQDVGALLGLTACPHGAGIGCLHHPGVAVLLLTSRSWHAGGGTGCELPGACRHLSCTQRATQRGVGAVKNRCAAVFVPAPGTGFRPEIMSLNTVRCGALESSFCSLG